MAYRFARGAELLRLGMRRWGDRLVIPNAGATNGTPFDEILVRCRRPNHAINRAVSWPMIERLTSSGGRFVVFVEPKPGEPNVCRRGRSYLHIDLIGPVRFSVDWGGRSNGYWPIASAHETKDGVSLSVHEGNKLVQLRLSWLDTTRLRVEPWNVTFVRCTQ
jgi:hypothetical protein